MRTGPDGEMKMTFQKAWNTLRQQKPGLFNFDQAPVSSKPYAQLLPVCSSLPCCGLPQFAQSVPSQLVRRTYLSAPRITRTF